MIGVFINGQRLKDSYGYKYTFRTIKEAKDACDKYGYRGYTYSQADGILFDDYVNSILNKIVKKNNIDLSIKRQLASPQESSYKTMK